MLTRVVAPLSALTVAAKDIQGHVVRLGETTLTDQSLPLLTVVLARIDGFTPGAIWALTRQLAPSFRVGCRSIRTGPDPTGHAIYGTGAPIPLPRPERWPRITGSRRMKHRQVANLKVSQMTVRLDIDTVTQDDASPRVLNILTISALNTLCFVGLTLGARVSGLGWGWALLVGWLGGGAAAIALAVVITILLPVASQREPDTDRRATERRAARPATLPLLAENGHTETALIDAWERDAATEPLSEQNEAAMPLAA